MARTLTAHKIARGLRRSVRADLRPRALLTNPRLLAAKLDINPIPDTAIRLSDKLELQQHPPLANLRRAWRFSIKPPKIRIDLRIAAHTKVDLDLITLAHKLIAHVTSSIMRSLEILLYPLQPLVPQFAFAMAGNGDPNPPSPFAPSMQRPPRPINVNALTATERDLLEYARRVDSIYQAANRQTNTESGIGIILYLCSAIRDSIRPLEWPALKQYAETPLQRHFLSYIASRSRELSAQGWHKYCEDEASRPANPEYQTHIAEFYLEKENIFLRVGNDDYYKIKDGIFLRLHNGELRLISTEESRIYVNGQSISLGEEYVIYAGDDVFIDTRRARFSIASVIVENPKTVWHRYTPHIADASEFQFNKRALSPTMLPIKYVVVKTISGTYAIRLGAKQHFQMIRQGEVFVSAGMLQMQLNETIQINGNTRRYKSIMQDERYAQRILLTTRLLQSMGFTVAVPR